MPSLQIERNRAVIRAELHGSDRARLVAFTHGGWMNRQMFDAQIEPLVKAGYRVLTWDLRGHGESAPRGITAPALADLADDLIALLGASGSSKPAILVGQSLGGMIAQHVALANPSHVAGLVTIGSPCINPDDRRTARRMAATWRSSSVVTGLLPRPLVTSMMAKGVAVERDVQEYVRSVVRQQARGEFRWVARAPLGAGKGLEGRSISVPVLVVRGKLDNSGAGKLTAATAGAWVLRDSIAQYVEIPDAGHQTNQDQPGLSNDLLLEFLSDVFPVSDNE